ncbi:MAG: hypothetical protein ACK559_11910, partial [bacterium]
MPWHHGLVRWAWAGCVGRRDRGCAGGGLRLRAAAAQAEREGQRQGGESQQGPHPPQRRPCAG